MLKKVSLVILALLLMGAGYEKPLLTRSEKAMGSFFEITVYDSGLKDEELKATVDKAYGLVNELENRLSSYKDDSVIGRLNKAKAGESFDLDDDTYEVLKRSLEVAKLSDGLFDVTVWPLKVLWSEAKKNDALPDKAAIESALPKVGYQYILLDNASKKVSLSKEGVQVDLGGIGKGYVVEKVAQFLAKNGVRSGLVNAGGNLKFFGAPPSSDGWKIGIENPRSLDDDAVTLLVDGDVGVATSGDYQDFYYYKGKRYSHIFDPHTGYPVSNGVVSVTIIAKDAFTADALDTAFLLMGPEKGFEMIDKLKSEGRNVEAVAIMQRREGGQLELTGSDGAMKLIKEVNL